MKVVDFVNKANEKKTVNPTRLCELKQYYVSMYRFYMLHLYDMGYISDPTLFNREEIIKNILDLEISGVYDVTGVIHLETSWVKYARLKNKREEASQFLDALYNVLKYKEYSHDLDIFYEEFNKNVSLRLKMVGSKIVPRSGVKLSRGSLQSLVSRDEKLYTISIKEVLWDKALEVLQIPEEDLLSDGLFDKDLSHEEEVDSALLLLEGVITPTGKYAKELEDWLFKHKWSAINPSNLKQGLISYVYTNYMEDVFAALKGVLSSIDVENVVCVLEDKVFVRDKIKNYKIPVSYFSVACGYEDIVLQDNNALNGYTGEAYIKEYLDEEGITYIGLPITILNKDNDKIQLYDREQVSIETNTWFKSENLSFYFEPVDFGNPYKDEDLLTYQLFDIYLRAQEGEMGSIPLEKFSIAEIEKAKRKVTKMILKLMS